jgi:hypothetical protein
MVRRRVSAVSNHAAPVWPRPSRRGKDAAPQDEEIKPVMTDARNGKFVEPSTRFDQSSTQGGSAQQSAVRRADRDPPSWSPRWRYAFGSNRPYGLNLLPLSAALRTGSGLLTADAVANDPVKPLVQIEARSSSHHGPTKSAHCRGLPTGVSLNQTAIARIERRHTNGAIGNSAPRFSIAYSTMNSVVPK